MAGPATDLRLRGAGSTRGRDGQAGVEGDLDHTVDLAAELGGQLVGGLLVACGFLRVSSDSVLRGIDLADEFVEGLIGAHVRNGRPDTARDRNASPMGGGT